MALLADEGRDEGKEVDSDGGGGGIKKKGKKMKRRSGRDEAGDWKTVERKRRMRKR